MPSLSSTDLPKEVESVNIIAVEDDELRPGQLKRQLKNRHIAMISVAGVIGTGLFLGTASALQQGGPLGLLLGYTAVGSLCYCVMISLGEMIAFLPLPGGHIRLAERFVDSPLSFAMGCDFCYGFLILLPTELSASSVLMNYWVSSDKVNNSVWISICLVVVIAINLLGTGVYGETEFIFASIKVITIVGLLILGLVLDLGGSTSNHDRIGFRYWVHPGPFNQFNGIAGAKGRFLAWWIVLTQAAFSFTGTEIVAIAAGEAKNPRHNLPKAIRRVYVRIILFYILGTLFIGLLVPYTDSHLNLKVNDGARSPFVIAVINANIKGLPSVINAAILTSAWSAASSDLYTSSRALYGLALVGNAPKFLLRTTRWGVPYFCVAFCSCFGLLAYMGVKEGSGRVFGWFQNMTAVGGLLSWFGISITYLRFYAGLKVHKIDRRKLPYTAPFQPYAAWYSGIFCFLICLFSGWQVFLRDSWDTATFVTNYLPLAIFPSLYFGCKAWKRWGWGEGSGDIVKLEDMDFVGGLEEVEEASYDEPPPRNWIERIWQWLM